MPASPEARETAASSLRGLVHTMLAMVRVRIELLATEASLAGHHLAVLLGCAVAAFLLLFLALVLGSLLLVAVLWDTPYRLIAAGAVTAMPAIAGAAFAIAFIGKVRAAPRLFDATLTALHDDLIAPR